MNSGLTACRSARSRATRKSIGSSWRRSNSGGKRPESFSPVALTRPARTARGFLDWRNQPSLHQPLECGPSIADLSEAGWRIRKVREKFLKLVDRLVALAGAIIELSQV